MNNQKGQSNFYAMVFRMKYINRWGLMNNTRYENLSEHSLEVSMLAHCLVLIHNKRFGGNLNPERASLLALYHDATEIITGDMPTPIKYYNPKIKSAYKEIESVAGENLISMLPDDFKEDFDSIINQNGAEDEKLKVFVKGADRLSALIKCIEEVRLGNDEFKDAKSTIEKSIKDMNLPEIDVFNKEFLQAFYSTLDNQT